jgi:hypothetical protein
MHPAFRLPGSLRTLMRLCLLAFLIALFPYQAKPGFWSLAKNEQPVTVKLVRKLPPVAARNGNTVQFKAEIADKATPPEVLPVLRDKIRTLLLKAGSIQLVDGPADTSIKCIITGYEPKIVRSSQRQVGNQHLQIATWIGNIRASVQVLDNHNTPIDSGDLKEHLENDFVIAQKEDSVAAVNDKRATKSGRLAGVIGVLRGGDAGDVASLAGGGKQLHDALGSEAKGAQPPTDLEWRDALIEGFAAKVANRVVPIDQESVAILPLDKDFAQIRDLAKSERWGDVQEQTEKMGQLQGNKEAFRLYTLGLTYEAIGYKDASHPREATESLNKASKYYDDARKVEPNERELLLAQIRVQDSLDHYLEIQHYLQARQSSPPPAPSSQNKPAGTVTVTQKKEGSGDPPPGDNAADNAALIAMAQESLPEAVMITFVQSAASPKFDVSANGLLQLARGKVPANVIQAVQHKMAAPSAPRRAAPVKPAAATPATAAPVLKQ